MNKFYIRDNEETSMKNQHDEYMPHASWLARKFWWLYALCIGLMLFGAINAFAQTARTAVITFTRPVDYTDGTPIASSTAVTYVVYQGARGATKVKVGTISATTATISTGLQPGETCWQVSAVANGIESALSSEGCKTFTFPAPNVVTITVT